MKKFNIRWLNIYWGYIGGSPIFGKNSLDFMKCGVSMASSLENTLTDAVCQKGHQDVRRDSCSMSCRIATADF